MAIVTPHNRWWWDVLENGPSSRYAAYFDVDWDPPEAELRNTVLLPVLGDHYGRVLEAGELRAATATAAASSSATTSTRGRWRRARSTRCWRAAAERCGSDELAFLADAHGRLAAVHRDRRGRAAPAPPRQGGAAPAARAAVPRAARRWRRRSTPRSRASTRDPDALDALLERQNYRLAFWRTAARDLGYRRFFDVNTPGRPARGGRARLPRHPRPGAAAGCDDGAVDGLRIDHPDGLRDPAGYFRRLRDARAAAPGWWWRRS